jgi:hypothetical protein
MVLMTMGKYAIHVRTIHSALEATIDKRERLHHHAQQCRALAESAITSEARKVLAEMALDYENRATTMQINGARSHPSG